LLAIEAVNARDYQVIQAVTLVVAAVYISINLLVDILYGYVDPRVRYS
jgi:ABC-type dipeptide/oligopeptide/nickel transport system permease component